MELSMGTTSAHEPWMAPQPCEGPGMVIRMARFARNRIKVHHRQRSELGVSLLEPAIGL
uniref:Uncharacterized protein n=1 Tax=Arundo donax TaxID=35708 RepID=A0A0A9A8N0_ARUDO